jgi:TrmH family RNA methyltransferase
MSAIVLTSRANPRVKQLRAAFAGNARLSGGLVAIEGEHLLQEALRSGLPIKTIFLSERIDAPRWLPRGVEILQLADETFASVVDTQHPQGIAALLIPPRWEMDSALAANRTGRAALVLVTESLQDPGNLGTLIRSAEAFGAHAVLTTPGTVSEWNQKTLRASAGSVFRVPVIAATHADIAALKARGLRLFAAVADGASGSQAIAVSASDLTQPCALMIGNEGAGLTAELLKISDARITIPTPGRIESLNAAVAGSLLLYEAARQRAVASNLEPRTLNLAP